MKVRVPKLNPIIFSQTGEYNPYNDAALKEQLFTYVQPYAATDRITFQIQWDNIPIDKELSINSQLYTKDSATSFYRNYSITGVTSGGDNYTNYYKQFLTNAGICGGYFVFDWLVSDIAEIVTGKQFCFYIQIGIKDLEIETTLTSNCFQLVSDVSDTKLLKYTQSYYEGNGIYDTYISVMTRGFYLRLPCYFKQPQPIFEKTVFENYRKDVELINSNVGEKYILHIGGSNGIPDWFIENLKFIFALDTKIIDNVQYELTVDSEFSVEPIEKFNNRMLDIEMQKSKNEYVKGYEQVIEYNVTTTTTTTTEQEYKSIADVGLMVANITIDHDRLWRIVPVTANTLNEVELSKITGDGKTIITAKVQKMVNSGAAKTYTLQVNDLISDVKVQNIVIIKPAITTGIGYGIIGDNLVIGITKI